MLQTNIASLSVLLGKLELSISSVKRVICLSNPNLQCWILHDGIS